MAVESTFIEGAELPHRVVIDEHLHGAGQTESDAVMAALSAGNIIPPEIRHDKKAAARFLFWLFEARPGWALLIGILEQGP